MDHSPFSRRGALAAVLGSVAALTGAGAARASASPARRLRERVVEDTRPSSRTASPADVRESFGDPFETHGWDTVSAVRLSEVNRAIADHPGYFPTAWDGHLPAGELTDDITATGTFGVWRVAFGGAEDFLAMEVPFEARLTAGGETVSVQGGLANLQVRLAFLTSPDAKDRLRLMVARDPSDGQGPPVTVYDVSFDSPEEGLPAGVLSELLQSWFNANPDEFAYVFALVDLGRNGDGDLAWLAPTAFDFAYYEGADATDSYLGVLCMTEGRPTPPRNGDPQPPLDGNAVPAGQGAALDISGERFMNRMVLPGLIRQFRASVGDFTEQPDGSLTSDSLDMNPITELGGTYYPHVTSLRVFMEAAELHVDMDVHIHVHPGIEVYVSLSHSLAPQLAAKGDRQYIVYQGAELSRHTRWTIEWWAEVEEFFMPVVTGLTTLGASMAADAVLQIMAIIAVDSATVAVQWTNPDEFVAGVVSLNGGLQIAGGYVG